MAEEVVYLSPAGVAERIGVKRVTINQYLSQGRMPEPDFVRQHGMRRYPLWKPETIDEWRSYLYKHSKNRPIRYRVDLGPRRARAPEVAPPEESTVSTRLGASRKRRRNRDVEGQGPVGTEVGRQFATDVARVLRADGHFCTPEDVLYLFNRTDEGLDYQERVMQDRIKKAWRRVSDQRRQK